MYKSSIFTFINNEQLLEIRECCKQAIKVTFAAELFDTQTVIKQNKTMEEGNVQCLTKF